MSIEITGSTLKVTPEKKKPKFRGIPTKDDGDVGIGSLPTQNFTVKYNIGITSRVQNDETFLVAVNPVSPTPTIDIDPPQIAEEVTVEEFEPFNVVI